MLSSQLFRGTGAEFVFDIFAFRATQRQTVELNYSVAVGRRLVVVDCCLDLLLYSTLHLVSVVGLSFLQTRQMSLIEKIGVGVVVVRAPQFRLWHFSKVVCSRDHHEVACVVARCVGDAP